MARKIITEEMKKQVVSMYRQGLKLRVIADTTGLSQPTISKIVRPLFASGEVKPHVACMVGRRPIRTGNWKPYIKKDRNPNKKLTEKQEQQLLEDYFVNDMTYKQIMAKYDLWQTSIKIIVDKGIAEGVYQPKGRGNRRRRKIQEGAI